MAKKKVVKKKSTTKKSAKGGSQSRPRQTTIKGSFDEALDKQALAYDNAKMERVKMSRTEMEEKHRLIDMMVKGKRKFCKSADQIEVTLKAKDATQDVSTKRPKPEKAEKTKKAKV